MNKIYLVNHCFDVDGGFGDAIPQEEVICGFDNREDANGFVEKYSNPHIYDSPYASLECGVLRVEELNMTQPDREDMWWLDQDKVSVVSVVGQSVFRVSGTNVYEAIIDADTWNAVQQELERRDEYCRIHYTNAYSQQPEIKPFSCKIICGECNHCYTRVTYTYRDGRKVAKWRCGSTNKAGGARVCSNRYVLEEAFVKLFIMSWNEIAGNYADYLECWNKNLEKDNELLRHKTGQLMAAAKKGRIKEFDGELMIMVMDYIKVFESGKLVIRFYDGTEFECETE